MSFSMTSFSVEILPRMHLHISLLQQTWYDDCNARQAQIVSSLVSILQLR